ncbi:MAG: signal recognition particle-docking protein FtsY, partial [Cyanobacteria bacterium J06606_4]
MAAFNWFERSYQAPTEESQNETAQNAENAEDQAEKDAPVSSEDYLNWAKAAYQNIQARQQEEASSEDVGTEEASTKEASQDQKTATDSDSSTTDTNTPTPELPSETASETTTADTTAETDTPADSDVAGPTQAFWAKAQQAQAEREERLERLQAEAILEPEPEAEPAAPETQFVPVD